jgi:hypothetical protein
MGCTVGWHQEQALAGHGGAHMVHAPLTSCTRQPGHETTNSCCAGGGSNSAAGCWSDVTRRYLVLWSAAQHSPTQASPAQPCTAQHSTAPDPLTLRRPQAQRLLAAAPQQALGRRQAQRHHLAVGRLPSWALGQLAQQAGGAARHQHIPPHLDGAVLGAWCMCMGLWGCVREWEGGGEE